MIRAVGVVVPAANEQATVGACLDALAVARSQLRQVAMRQVDVRIVVVLDGCVDATARITRRHRGIETLACSVGQVGAARAAGSRWLLTNAGVAPGELWLASTDADSAVPRDWLAVQVDEAERGAHLVLGTVEPESGLAARTERAWFDGHRLRDGHPHVHGANLGIRADVYMALGGWPSLASGEDVELADRAAAAGHLRIARKANIPVRTSIRRTARAPLGFARYLRGLESDDVAVG